LFHRQISNSPLLSQFAVFLPRTFLPVPEKKRDAEMARKASVPLDQPRRGSA
jgi:hypothetical protein